MRSSKCPPRPRVVGPLNLPVAGGGYFRILPYGWTRWGIARLNRAGAQARRSSTCTRGRSIPTSRGCRQAGSSRFRHYRNLDKTEARLRRLLRDFSFGSMQDILRAAEIRAETTNPAWALPYLW